MKNIIAETFFAMVKEKGVDKVTVKDLVETCHISRQTFYYHFQDLLDVVEWSARKGIQRAVDMTLEVRDPQVILEKVVEAAMENWEIMESLMKSPKRESIERIFADTLREYLLEIIQKEAPGLEVSHEDATVAIQFYANGIAGVLLGQCGKADCDPKRLARQLLALMRGRVFETV
ncbi:MAG: TetR/AcrR family transcriptional regulator C-terminal domain-containing protein [Ruminiclostridium sp.]|nr:TetR/AcrR family transcriptional regulator C-terminal domain-containing protein [Ruminiclostridium sp.]